MKKIHRFFTAPAALAIMLSAGGVLAGHQAALAVPARPGTIIYTQPDGTTLPITVQGDERANAAYDMQGRRLVRNEEGYLLPATPAQLRAAAETRAAGEDTRFLMRGPAFPVHGSPKAVVILVDFPNQKFSMENPREYYSDMLNKAGYDLDGATGSARDYFIENSSGAFTPQFDVYGPVTTKNLYGYYGSNGFDGSDKYAYQAVIEACDGVDDEVDFMDYDANEDGYIDNVFVIYAGYGENDSYIEKTIWPHSADISDFSLGRTYRYDYKVLNRYAMTCELIYELDKPDGVGTFIHEFSHVMGLPDLYSTDYEPTAYSPNLYSILDMGPYLNEGRTPPYYSSFERYSLDWLTPEEFPASGEYTIEALHKSNKAYIVKTEHEDEFFLIENRHDIDWDAYLINGGMLVWHIDYVKDVWDKNVVNNTPTHQYVDLIEADDLQDLASSGGDPFPGSAGVTELSFTTTPALKAWSGKTTGISFSDIRRNQDGTLSLSVKYDKEPGAGVAEVADANGISVAGRVIANASGDTIDVFDLAGRRVAAITAGTSAELPAGLYIASGCKYLLK
ncbi:MAG: M6 family metalloprotease domain-containing protein [Bacteroides sp.]|nr:M6 family metalloprotease domain-containing protein [Bacteroides sp.]